MASSIGESTYKLRDVVALARHASMSTTYKPALLKAITKIVTREKDSHISLKAIGDEFARLYWNQTVVFHLRQAAVLSKEPEVLQRVRETAARFNVRDFALLPAIGRDAISVSMAAILKIDVLQRFHVSKPANMPFLFEWTAASDAITLSDEGLAFVQAEAATLEVIANYWWAKYLEKVNLLAPAIIQKVERDGARRGSIRKFYYLLLDLGEDECFYCRRPLGEAVAVAVDHVLPWSFLMLDPLWDLVLACALCNGSKSDKLPEARFIDKLVACNVKRSASLERHLVWHESEIRQLYQAAISLEWPGSWTPIGAA